jgi:hypothetical protein
MRQLRDANSESLTSKIGAGFSAGFSSFRRILVQLGSGGERVKPRGVSVLHVHSFWCDRLGRILSPVQQQ